MTRIIEHEAEQLKRANATEPQPVAFIHGRPPISTRGPRRRSTRKNPERGPLLLISGEKDNTVPWEITDASFKLQQRNKGVTEIVEIPNRGHALPIDSGRRTVADTALAFVQRVVHR